MHGQGDTTHKGTEVPEGHQDGDNMKNEAEEIERGGREDEAEGWGGIVPKVKGEILSRHHDPKRGQEVSGIHWPPDP